jgi:uncharacterized protein
MTGVWGDESIFDDVDEAQSILNALMMHYITIGAELAKGRKRYRPYGWPDDYAERASSETAAEWSFGFWKAMLLRPYDWEPLIRDDNTRALLAPILCFIKTLRGNADALDDRMIDAAEMIPDVVPVIRQYWRSASKAKQPRSVRPGRNDACSCGSGKKYKRCCGAG